MASLKGHAPVSQSDNETLRKKVGNNVLTALLWSLDLCPVTPMEMKPIILDSRKLEHSTEICVCLKDETLSSQKKDDRIKEASAAGQYLRNFSVPPLTLMPENSLP